MSTVTCVCENIGTKGVASNIGEKVQQTGESIAEGGKSAVNTTVETGGRIAHGAWDGTKHAAATVVDGTKNLAAAGVEKTEQAWQGTQIVEFGRDVTFIY